MTYPATNLNEAVGLIVPDSNALHEIINGEATETVTLPEGDSVPTVRKAIADSLLFKNPISWDEGNNETEYLQLRIFTDSLIYWAPNATASNPISMGVTPVGDSNWKLAPLAISKEAITETERLALGSNGIYKGSNDNYVQDSDTVPSGTTHLTVLRGGVPTDVLINPITSGVVSLLTGSTATIGGTEVKLIPKLYSGVIYVDAVGIGGIVDDTSAFQEAIDQASALQYVKRGVKIVARAPENYYQISAPLTFDELWNINFECEVKNAWNRSEFGDVETTGGNIHWIGNSTDSLFDFGQYCFGIQFKNIVVNGRDTLKLAYDMSQGTPSVLRDYCFDNCGAIRSDFMAVIGGISGTDSAPIRWINPIATYNKSLAILINSGNAQVTIDGGFFAHNGYSPSTGNSFIPDVDNAGYQILQRAGHTWIENGTIFDGLSPTLPASGENIRCSSGSMSVSAWDDTPEVVSVRITGVTQSFSFGHFVHYDGDMTKLNTPTSIIHDAGCSVSFHSGMSVFGNIEINSGSQAGGLANGVNFLDSTSVFTGTGLLGFAGFNQDDNAGDMTLHIGGTEIFPGDDAAPSKISVHSRPNRPVIAAQTTAGSSVPVTWNLKDNGQWEFLTNIWYDTGTSQYKSIAAGAWCRKLLTSSGVEQMNAGTAAGADEVLSFSIAFGTRKGVGGNGKFVLELSDNQMGFEIPASGLVTRGSVYFRSSATAGGKAGDIVTTAGTIGSTAVTKPFGVIDA